ncbi:LEC14B homolog [Neltuma alba]|uniref:LEC14B homolog n=1 Tax=Neltuma alba TaxID=207710 RepID=UPI0010A2B96B|nr:LEC14B homolog [Prosopis alba]
MSRFGKEIGTCDDGTVSNESSASGSARERTVYLDHEIAQLTKLRSSAHKLFGCVEPGRTRLPVSTVRMLAGREANYSGLGRFSSRDGCHVLSRYLPTNGPWLVDRMESRAYVSQFSAEGSLFIAGSQGSHIRVYDVDRDWKVVKDISARNLRWTITDTSLSPDQCYLVYASMSPVVHIVNVVGSATGQSIANVTEIHNSLDLSSDEDDDEFGIFSVKFSTDGRELVAATSDSSICVYDLRADKLSLRIPAHVSDVNTVCFADESGHLIYSGSDDGSCKVNLLFYPGLLDDDGIIGGWITPNRQKNIKHPHDQSLATYRGHSVLRTLIRCYFSPSYSTGQKYIYTGSSDGSVYIYDLVSGAQVAKLDHHEGPVRDCSWHPVYPMLISSSWDGDIVRWEFPGRGEPIARPNRRALAGQLQSRRRRRNFFNI